MKIFEVSKAKPFVFVDMDGVLADFNKAILNYDGADTESRVNNLRKLGPNAVKDFFASLPPMVDGMRLIEWLDNKRIDWRILSAPLRSDGVDPKNSRKASEIGKRDWLASNLGWEVAKKPFLNLTNGNMLTMVINLLSLLMTHLKKLMHLTKQVVLDCYILI